MTLDGRILRGLFNHEILKPTIIRTSQGNLQNSAQLKQQNLKVQLTHHLKSTNIKFKS